MAITILHILWYWLDIGLQRLLHIHQCDYSSHSKTMNSRTNSFLNNFTCNIRPLVWWFKRAILLHSNVDFICYNDDCFSHSMIVNNSGLWGHLCIQWWNYSSHSKIVTTQLFFVHSKTVTMMARVSNFTCNEVDCSMIWKGPKCCFSQVSIPYVKAIGWVVLKGLVVSILDPFYQIVSTFVMTLTFGWMICKGPCHLHTPPSISNRHYM